MSRGEPRPLSSLARTTRILLIAQATIAGMAAIMTYAHGGPVPEDNALYALVVLVQFLLYIAGGIVFLIWVYRSTANAHAFGAEGMSAGPGLAVGWYFIPIANLWMPLTAMRETWKASVNPPNWEVERAPATMGLWWFFWITGNIAGIAAARLGWEEAAPETAGISYILSIASDLLTIPGALLLTGIVGAITRLQADRMNHQQRGIS
jgi:Domain of unknown function (DUF4328)